MDDKLDQKQFALFIRTLKMIYEFYQVHLQKISAFPNNLYRKERMARCYDDKATPHLVTFRLTLFLCNNSTQEHFHIVTLQPTGVTVRTPPNRSVRSLKSGSKRWLWQSDLWVSTTENLTILCSAWGWRDSVEHRTQMALIKNTAWMAHPTELHQYMGQPGMCPNLT